MIRNLKIGSTKLLFLTQTQQRLAPSIPASKLTQFVQPDDWDEDAPFEIPDEDAEKPEGWLDDELTTIPDPGMLLSKWLTYISLSIPDATKPEEWDDSEDGDWIAPTVPNPKCTEGPGCGEWKR